MIVKDCGTPSMYARRLDEIQESPLLTTIKAINAFREYQVKGEQLILAKEKD